MPQDLKESSSPAENKATSQDNLNLRRRPIHPPNDDKDKKGGSLKDKEEMVENQQRPVVQQPHCGSAWDKQTGQPRTKENLYPKPEDYMDDGPDIGKNLNEHTISSQNRTMVKESSLNMFALPTHFHNIGILILIGVLFMTGVYHVTKSYGYFMTESHVEKPFVSQLIDNMRNKFSDQSNLTFKILKSALKPVVDESCKPSAPAIIILLANQIAVKTAWEFSENLAQLLRPENVFKIDSRVYGDSDPKIIKSNIDEKLKSNLNDDSLNVIMVDNLENIPFEAAMIFHSYCDHENARLKRAVYLFVVPSSETILEDASSKYIDGIAMKSLRRIWHKAHTDLIESLITRITVNVVNIK